jgi:hypothetical protein
LTLVQKETFRSMETITVTIEATQPCPKPAALTPVEVWAELSPEERDLFARVVRALHRERIPFLVAGAFGLYHYTGYWRGTKDMDLLILPEHREIAIEAVCGVGLQDMFRAEPYDRDWIFRTRRDEVIVDLIWRFANKADEVHPDWMERGVPATIFNEPVKVVSAADLCWMKLFVLQRSRSDWPDILNVIRGTGGQMEWQLLLNHAGEHWRLLAAITDIWDWLCPAESRFIPGDFRAAIEARRRDRPDSSEPCRKDLLDSRPWLTEPRAGCHQ